MKCAGRRVFLPPLALIVLSGVCSLLVSTHSQAGDPPSLVPAIAALNDPFSPTMSWVDSLEERLKTYFSKKYPAYDFAPYERELDRVRTAASRGDRWGVKRETGVFLKMLTTHAYGLGDDAAEELTAISNRIMPEEEFGIIYPGARPEPLTNRDSNH